MKKAVVTIAIIVIACILAGYIQLNNILSHNEIDYTQKQPITWLLLDN